ncbi:hypothetical protein WJX82_007324 [Trebouxia sp. C0006]
MEKDGGCGQCSPAGMASVCHFYVVICGFITTGWAQRHNDVTPVLGCEDAQVGHQNVTAGTRHLQAPLLSCNTDAVKIDAPADSVWLPSDFASGSFSLSSAWRTPLRTLLRLL